MMDSHTGDFVPFDLLAGEEPPAPEPGKLLVFGTEDDMRAAAARLRLGELELERRKARRKAQKAARRQNR